MKKTLLPLYAAALTALGSTAAFAQVDVTITGSTAFRAITIDRAWGPFDVATRTAVTNNATTGLITISGTMQGSAPTLGTTPVKVRLSFSGSSWKAAPETPTTMGPLFAYSASAACSSKCILCLTLPLLT